MLYGDVSIRYKISNYEWLKLIMLKEVDVISELTFRLKLGSLACLFSVGLAAFPLSFLFLKKKSETKFFVSIVQWGWIKSVYNSSSFLVVLISIRNVSLRFGMRQFVWHLLFGELSILINLINGKQNAIVCRILYGELSNQSNNRKKQNGLLNFSILLFLPPNLQINLPSGGRDGWWNRCQGEDLLCESKTTTIVFYHLCLKIW